MNRYIHQLLGWMATLLLAGMRGTPHRREARGSDLLTLRNAGRRFLPPQRVDELLRHAPANGPVPALIESRLEHELAAILGSASARLLLDAARRDAAVDVDRRGADLDTVAAIVGEASEDQMSADQVASGSIVGQFGIERVYNKLLMGADGARRVVVAGQHRRQAVHRSRQVRQEAPRALEGLVLGIHRGVDGAARRFGRTRDRSGRGLRHGRPASAAEG